MRHEIIPNLRYDDAPRAIDFLCAAFGFARRAVYPDDKDPRIIHHAQLVWNDRMIMISSHNDGEATRAARIKRITETGGPTLGLYLIVEDIDAHAAHARSAGAEIVLPPRDQDYGGRGYTARDTEGYVWSFGSYDPWTET